MTQTASSGPSSTLHDELTKFITEVAVPKSTEFVERDGQHDPLMCFKSKSGDVVMMALGPLHRQWAMLRFFLRRYDVDWYFVVSEAWLAKYSQHNSMEVKPSQREDKVEVLMIAGNTRDDQPVVRALEFQRQESGQIKLVPLEESKNFEEMGGDMLSLLKEE